MIQHFPILSIMSLFLGSFLIVVFGGKNRVVRNLLSLVFSTIPLVLICWLIKPVILDGTDDLLLVGRLGTGLRVCDWYWSGSRCPEPIFCSAGSYYDFFGRDLFTRLYETG